MLLITQDPFCRGMLSAVDQSSLPKNKEAGWCLTIHCVDYDNIPLTISNQLYGKRVETLLIHEVLQILLECLDYCK